MEESLKFLSGVFDLLQESEVFDTRSNNPKSVVDFKHPQELSVSYFFDYLDEFFIKNT